MGSVDECGYVWYSIQDHFRIGFLSRTAPEQLVSTVPNPETSWFSIAPPQYDLILPTRRRDSPQIPRAFQDSLPEKCDYRDTLLVQVGY